MENSDIIIMEEVMNFSDVINYFELNTFAINNGKGGMNQEIAISGKVRKNSLLVFLFFTVPFVVWDIMSVIGSGNITLLPLILDICAYCFVFLEHIILFYVLKKRTKIDFYQRQLPSNLKPAHVRMLMNDGLIDKVSVGTTLMDLIDKGYLKIKEHEQDNDFFKYNDEAVLIKTNKDTIGLLKYEEFLIDWFINVCGDGSKVTKKELHDRLDDLDSVTSNDRYNEFKAYVIISYPFYKLYKNHLKIHKYKSFLAIGLILFTAFVMPIFSFLFSFISIAALPIIAFGLLCFNNPAYTLNDSGSIEFNNWMALKKFLHEFTIIKERNAEMISLWSFYLTYSVALEENKIAKDEIIDFFGINIHAGNDANSSYNESYAFGKKLSDNEKEKIEQVIREEKTKYNFKSIFIE